MHIIENHYFGLELKNPSKANVLRKTASIAADAYEEALGDCSLAEKELIRNDIQVFLSDSSIGNHLFTQTAQEVINNIKVTESFDLDILRVLPTNERLPFKFLYGKDRFIGCLWSNNELYIIDLRRDVTTGVVERNVLLASLKSSPKVFSATLADAIKCLIFLKLTEPEIIHLAAGKKYGTRKKGHYNATSLPIIIVDSTWNQYIVRTEGFGVSGHFRLQRHGKGNADLKLTWIKPYQKTGYVRLSKAETLNA
ncbi:hypothetical protein [Hymenobacter metallicola]|uniref:Uncharacterized protein n=1 Tax=Hymenobacter metallicola TaxID=2563114 RepID=A0A4Z0PTP6_9BACT|nr:hypothetical protein [Hymenobacter metallicola]TGE20855.1 hypothetical protein E5K02_25385 [Hymenobacter metallicola]